MSSVKLFGLRMRKTVLVITAILIISIGVYAYFPMMVPPAPFSMREVPEGLKGDAIVGQRCVFLVVVVDEGDGRGKGLVVGISATAPDATIAIEPQRIVPGQVCEVIIIPGKDCVGKTLTVTIRGDREGVNQIKKIAFEVFEGDDDGGSFAIEMRGRFIKWLVANHTELGITSKTEWIGTIISPRWLVVSHYLFFSKDWEMHVQWHNMIPPYDWVRIDLRRRYTETRPSYAFEISSVSTDEEPHSISPPDMIWR